ncbi:MAG: GAF domain-containing sensor histidine kinase [Acidobacteria bacterium]|nr:GAF domain-containing sensor histidine kinase [Acidobacteriota bacterium]
MLSDQLHGHLQRLATLLAPHAEGLDRRFGAALRRRRFDVKQRSALAAITLGAAARLLAAGEPLLKFLEQVEYSGRRLAKLNLPPSAILGALAEYDRLLAPVLRRLDPAGSGNSRWVREQLHFCVILTLNNAYYQVREAETQAFYELFRVEVESRTLDQMLQRFLVALSEFCRSDAATLYLADKREGRWVQRAAVGWGAEGDGGPVAARGLVRELAKARFIRCEERTQRLVLHPGWQRFSSCWSVPLVTGGRLAGAMQFAFSKDYEWLPREQDLLAVAAERCLMAAEKAGLMEDLAAREEQIRQLAEHMLHVEEVERRRIGRELHDEAGQSMLCIRLQLEMLEHAPPAEREEWSARLAEIRDLTERTILEIRRLIAALSPAVLEQLGLGAALRQLVTRFRRVHPCRARLHLARLAGLPQELEIMVYRLVQECCNNIAKHSQAANVNISVTTADGRLRLQVEDDGVGFRADDAPAKRDSFGLAGLRERVALLGGDFQIASRPAAVGGRGKSGTRIAIELPVSREGETAKAARLAS